MKNIILFFICLITTIPIFSQTARNLYIGSGVSTLFLQSVTTPDAEKFNAKYLNTEWGLGNLQTVDDKMLTNVAFKYNVTKDKFEMRADVNPEIVGRITYDGKVFVYSEYVRGGFKTAGYFEQLCEGTAVLLQKYSIHTVSGKKGAFGYDAYQNVSKDLYIKIDDKPATILDKKKEDVLTALAAYKTEVDEYVKNNKLNLSKKKDIINLLDFYTELSSGGK